MRHSGEAIGTHNGTIYNVDYLFRLYKLRLWRANLAEYSMEPFEFIARERRGVEP